MGATPTPSPDRQPNRHQPETEPGTLDLDAEPGTVDLDATLDAEPGTVDLDATLDVDATLDRPGTRQHPNPAASEPGTVHVHRRR